MRGMGTEELPVIEITLVTRPTQETKLHPRYPKADEATDGPSVTELEDIENRVEREKQRKGNAPRAGLDSVISGYDKGEGRSGGEEESAW